jgi:predicted transcriptional regulator
MIATYYRQMAWEDVQARLVDDRLAVYLALQMWGPCTTRQLARLMDRDILSVRPRVTELLQMGFAVEVEVSAERRFMDRAAREGYYRAERIEDVERAHRRGVDAPIQAEMQLGGV